MNAQQIPDFPAFQVAQLMEETSEAGRCWHLPPRLSSSEPYQWYALSQEGKALQMKPVLWLCAMAHLDADMDAQNTLSQLCMAICNSTF